MSKPRGFLGRVLAQLMGEVKLTSPGPGGNKTSSGSAEQGEREEIFNFSVPSCWNRIEMNKEKGKTSEMQVGIARFSGMAYLQFTLPVLALLFTMNTGKPS